MLFWVAAAVAALAVAALVLRPLFRRGADAAPRAAHDMQVFRDQLAAIDRDVERGALGADEAEGAKAEVSRRLLSAAAEAERSAGASPAPAALSRAIAAGLALAVLGGGAGLYVVLGAPGAADLPLQERLARMQEAARDRMTQAEAERRFDESAERETQEEPPASANEAQMRELVERLREVLEERPGDLRGRRLLAGSLRRLGEFEEALAAQRQALEIAGDAATAADHADLGELMILRVGGYVSPEAEAEIRKALEMDPGHPSARYYAGLALAQNGRADLALPLWADLVRGAPADAPWAPMVRAQIADVAAAYGLPEPDLPAARSAPPPGPSREDMQAVADMSAEERREMIEGMVARLGERLAEEGGAPGEWARLIGALGVLGRSEEAAEVWAEAREAFAASPDALAELRQAAERAGVAE